MDVETLLLVAGALTGLVGGIVATIVGALHIYGWLPNRYVAKLHEAQKGIAVEIGQELRAVFSEQEAKVAEAMKAQEAAYADQVKGAEMSMVRAVGVDKQLRSKVDRLLGEAVLGPAMPLLRQFAPGLADALEENPQLLDVVVQNPLFKKYVAPRLEQYLGGQTTQTPASSGGWGT